MTKKGNGHRGIMPAGLKRTRIPRGKNLIKKVPETPVKGSTKKAVHTPEKEKRQHIERPDRQGSQNAGESKYRRGIMSAGVRELAIRCGVESGEPGARAGKG